MFACFLCALFCFFARKFPAKSESREPGKFILECPSYVCLSFILIEDVCVFVIFVRINAENIHSSCDRSRFQGDWPICTRLKYFVWPFEWGFLFNGIFISHHNLIFHSIIAINSSIVFTDDVFLYLPLFTLMYGPPIRYVIYEEYHVSTK